MFDRLIEACLSIGDGVVGRFTRSCMILDLELKARRTA
jgi:hypothetical protein